jgi:hypothetical protein
MSGYAQKMGFEVTSLFPRGSPSVFVGGQIYVDGIVDGVSRARMRTAMLIRKEKK